MITTNSVTYEPWSDGNAVGFKVTHHRTQRVEYIYLNPSHDSDGDVEPDVFIYQGRTGNPGDDTPLCFFTVHREAA